MTAYEARKRLVDKALTFVGTTEGSIVHKLIVDEYNKIDPLPRGYKVKYTDPWCATFVSVCAKTENMLDIIPAECGCPEMVRKFQAMGRWQERDDYRPALGDIAFYDWGNSSGDNTGTPAHVGIVTAVYTDSFVITEGNRSDAVRNITVAVNDRNLRGFGLPDFARWLIDHGYTGGGDFPVENNDPSKWARAAWQWAKENRITDGTRPHDSCTREELVTMLYRYNQLKEASDNGPISK